MHHIHHTKGLILTSRNNGLADRSVYIFTEELGLVIAKARSSREIRSKLRGHLQECSQGNFSLVRGKSGWILVGAEAVEHWEKIFGTGSERLKLFVRISVLLSRFINGEEQNIRLYGLLESAFSHLKTLTEESTMLNEFETLFVLRILDCLGYVEDKPFLKELSFESIGWLEGLQKIKPIKLEVLVHINRAFKESHL